MILSDIAKHGKSEKVEKVLLKKKSILVFAYPSIMEIGFGPSIQAPVEEIEISKEMYSGKSVVNDLRAIDLLNLLTKNCKKYKGKWFGVLPDSNSWFGAKNALIQYMEDRRTLPKNAKKYQLDALLSITAWNINAFVWTEDVYDYILINFFELKSLYGHLKEWKDIVSDMIAPIFNTKTLLDIIDGKAINAYASMKQRIRDKVILDILDIAISKCD